jgi:hypothetical protein
MEIPRSRIKTLKINTPDVEVILKDADTIQGRLVKEDESGIILEHKDLGRMEISRDRIASSKVEVPDATVELAGGDIIEGKVVDRSDYAIILEHPNLGRIEIPRERIDSLKIKEPEFVRTEEETGWFDPELRKLAAKTSRLKEEGWKAEGLIGADFNWDITEKQKCTFLPYFFPVVGEMDDYRARISGEWRFLFGKDMKLSFLTGTLYEYTSIVDPDKDHEDLRTYLGLRFGF